MGTSSARDTAVRVRIEGLTIPLSTWLRKLAETPVLADNDLRLSPSAFRRARILSPRPLLMDSWSVLRFVSGGVSN